MRLLVQRTTTSSAEGLLTGSLRRVMPSGAKGHRESAQDSHRGGCADKPRCVPLSCNGLSGVPPTIVAESRCAAPSVKGSFRGLAL